MSDATPAEDPVASGATVITEAGAPPVEPKAPEPASPPEVQAAVEHRHPSPEAGTHGAHPTDAQYVKIALILAAITAVEVAVSYFHHLGDAEAPLLLVLAATKFFIVGAYFMHLRFDNRVLKRLFTTGIVLACIIYAIVFLLLGVFTGTHGAHA